MIFLYQYYSLIGKILQEICLLFTQFTVNNQWKPKKLYSLFFTFTVEICGGLWYNER